MRNEFYDQKNKALWSEAWPLSLLETVRLINKNENVKKKKPNKPKMVETLIDEAEVQKTENEIVLSQGIRNGPDQQSLTSNQIRI